MTKDHTDLLRKAVEEATGKDDPELLALIEELLDLEQQVAHMARPHRILLTIEERLKHHLGVE